MPGTMNKVKGSKSGKSVEEMRRDLEKMGCTFGSALVLQSNTSSDFVEMLCSRDSRAKSDFIRAKNEADKIITGILDDIESGKVEPPHVSYEDPCQSPVVDAYEAQLLIEKWNSMMDMPLSNSIHGRLRSFTDGYVTNLCFDSKQYDMKYFSPVFMAVFLGNLEDFIQLINNLSKSEIDRLLNKREGYLQFNPIFLPIIGAKIFQDPEKVAKLEKKEDPLSGQYLERSQRKHMELLEKLVELGADVNVHDLVGYTPLHHCFAGVKKELNDYTLQMAGILLKNGANVNAVDRFGNGPLIECVKNRNEESIKLLISYKANPLLKNYAGGSVLSNYAAKNCPEIYALLKEGVENVVKDERVAVENKYQVCEKCSGFAKNRCSACFFVWYCGVTCQKSDWNAHKATCKRMRQ